MGAMKNLAIETEELFNADNFWAEFTKVEDHGLMMYAFCGSRWAWTNSLHKENNKPSTREPYYLRGEGVSGDSLIFCGECAVDFAMATGLQPAPDGTYASEEDPDSVQLAKVRVTTQYQREIRYCPCGNVLFYLYEIEAVAEEFEKKEMSLYQMLDLAFLQGYYDHVVNGDFIEYCEPMFDLSERA